MRILLAAVNAKFIHTALGVRALRAYVGEDAVDIAEFTINERVQDAVREIYERRADMVMFSCYIWNIEFILKTAGSLRKIAPDTAIVFGGPEVSFDSVYYMEKYPFIDAVIRGEGEETLRDIIGSGLAVRGVTHRDGGRIVEEPDRPPVCDINDLPFPYTDRELDEYRDKLLYYESSRGCPFRCSYCLSSTVHSVRFRDIETVKRELAVFAEHGARVVKLTDRTFNADRRRAAGLIEYLSSLRCRTQFHFEIAAELIDDETAELFRRAPRDRFLLEIGVQSTNPETLSAIDRPADIQRIAAAAERLRGHVHMHLDLIAGLPYEDHGSFVNSFNEVMAMRPDVLQLGFLKLLRGTKLREEAGKHGYKFTDEPPYEVLANNYMSYDELTELKRVEVILDRYYNSSGFEHSLGYLSGRYDTPYAMFLDIAMYFEARGYFGTGMSQRSLYAALADMYDDPLFKDLLKLDFFININNPSTPQWAAEPFDRTLLKRRFAMIESALEEGRLPGYEGVPLKEIIKTVQAERFSYNVLGGGEKIENIILFDKKYGRVTAVSDK